jgi:hypothetical protein
MNDPLHPHDLEAFIAVLGGVIILILVGHAGPELLTAAAAATTGIYSLWSRRPRPPHDPDHRNRP